MITCLPRAQWNVYQGFFRALTYLLNTWKHFLYVFRWHLFLITQIEKFSSSLKVIIWHFAFKSSFHLNILWSKEEHFNGTPTETLNIKPKLVSWSFNLTIRLQCNWSELNNPHWSHGQKGTHSVEVATEDSHFDVDETRGLCRPGRWPTW